VPIFFGLKGLVGHHADVYDAFSFAGHCQLALPD
jgi:hypothetical protein